MPKPKKLREVIKILREHDRSFNLYTGRGKGSERMIYHPDIKGRAESYPVRCHGLGDEIGPGTLNAIIRRFDLPLGIFD